MGSHFDGALCGPDGRRRIQVDQGIGQDAASHGVVGFEDDRGPGRLRRGRVLVLQEQRTREQQQGAGGPRVCADEGPRRGLGVRRPPQAQQRLDPLDIQALDTLRHPTPS